MTRVLVTRAAEDARPLCHALQVAGFTPVSVPLLQRNWAVDAVAACAAEHPDADWVLVTSATTADVIAAAAPRAWETARIGAVGPVTARKLDAIGRPADRVPETQLGAALVAALPDLTGKKVVYPRADLAPTTLADTLRARGAEVVEVVAYENVAPVGHRRALAAALPVDATTLLSGSAAQRLRDAWTGDVAALGTVVVIGPSTAAATRSLGIPVHAVARPHTVNGLLSALGAVAPP